MDIAPIAIDKTGAICYYPSGKKKSSFQGLLKRKTPFSFQIFTRKEVKKMNEKRKGEIAMAFLKYRIGREGIRLTPDIKRDLGNVAKETGIPQDELKEFVKLFIKELLEETFGK